MNLEHCFPQFWKRISDNVLVTNSHVKKLMLSGDGIDLVSEHKSPKQIQLKVLVA